NMRNELVLETRFEFLALLVAIVAGGAFVNALLIAPWRARRAAAARQRPASTAAPPPVTKLLAPLAPGFVIVYPALVLSAVGLGGAVKWIDNFGIQILIYVMLGLGLNIVVGLAGLLDLGYVAFYAVGAYSYALLAQTFGFSFFILL